METNKVQDGDVAKNDDEPYVVVKIHKNVFDFVIFFFVIMFLTFCIDVAKLFS